MSQSGVLKLDQSVKDMKRWDILDDFLVKGKRYRFTMYDGEAYEADYLSICYPDDELEMDVKNTVDCSENPRFKDGELSGWDANDIASVEEVA